LWYLQPAASYETNPDVVIDNTFTVAATYFVQNVLRVTDTAFNGSFALEAYPPSSSRVDWSQTFLGHEEQNNYDIPVTYFITWYTMMQTPLTNSTFATYRDWMTSQNNATTFIVNVYPNQITWRHQTVVKAVQPSYAFLSLLLALIGVLHLVHFGLEVTEVFYYAYGRGEAFYEHSKKLAKQAVAQAKSPRGGQREKGKTPMSMQRHLGHLPPSDDSDKHVELIASPSGHGHGHAADPHSAHALSAKLAAAGAAGTTAATATSGGGGGSRHRRDPSARGVVVHASVPEEHDTDLHFHDDVPPPAATPHGHADAHHPPSAEVSIQF
jgi:hypothetical protein